MEISTLDVQRLANIVRHHYMPKLIDDMNNSISGDMLIPIHDELDAILSHILDNDDFFIEDCSTTF